MTQSRGHVHAPSTRIDALRARHASIASDIDKLMKHRSISDLDLRRLKQEKLQIKEEIERVQQVS